jgi:hypothetical protein
MNKTDIRKDLVKLIHKTFPHGVVELTVVPEDSYLYDLASPLRDKLAKLHGAQLLYEREPEPELEWAAGDDPDEDIPLDRGLSASYHVFFLGLAGEAFRYPTEAEGETESGRSRTFAGEGRVGCALGLSVLAPLAVIRFSQLEHFDDGSQTLPDIWEYVYSLEGQPIDPEIHFQETFGSQVVRTLSGLRNRMAKTVESLGITVLPPAEACKPVPWLVAGEEAFVGTAIGKPSITVMDAFFFQLP